MRLKAIKLSGFKSFVDPTHIPINGNRIGIVGPNGCGKSNVMDAVRWVMGESSPSRLRGDSMADVVFNGSNSRNPVGQASVELLFDNSDGRAGGEYASYSEISIRREAGRDGQSDYYLNRTRCRRKDITDLFLGTGLGPRTYSIIEQGMVTRIVEAKPEDLRGFIEEAAGISRYRERRRETENRIKHTRENLARVEDIRRELGAQLARLEKQSKAAAKYKELKQEERVVRGQLLALKYRDLDLKVQEHDRILAEQQNALDAVLAEQRAVEAEIERLRAAQADATGCYNEVHSEFYTVGGEIQRLEQAIEHARETRANQEREREQVNRSWDESSAHLRTDQALIAGLEHALAELAPKLAEQTARRDAAAAARDAAERAMQAWQSEWENFSAQAAEQAKQREIQLARLHQLERHLSDLEARRQRLHDEGSGIDTELGAVSAEALRREAEETDRQCETHEQQVAELDARIRELRQAREQAAARLEALRPERHNTEARLNSLRELQQAAQAQHDAPFAEWLNARGLDQAPRLAGRLGVESGWEKAVERVLGIDLVGVCVHGFDQLAGEAVGLKPPQLTLVDLDAAPGQRSAGARPQLLDKISSDLDVAPLLAGIYVADDLNAALAARAELGAQESIVTRDGAWVGRNWVNLANESGERAGFLAREREIEKLQRELTALQETLAGVQQELTQVEQQLQQAERAREDAGRVLNDAHRTRAQMREQLGHKEARLTQLENRRAQVRREVDELDAQLLRDRGAVAEATGLLQAAEAAGSGHDAQRQTLTGSRQSLQAALDTAREQETRQRDDLHRFEIERQGVQTQFESTRSSVTRLESQLAQLGARREELERLLAADNQPEAELRLRLDQALAQRVQVDARLTEARKVVTDLDTELRVQEEARHAKERAVQEERERHETERVARQELAVRRDTFAEQLREVGADVAQVLAETPAEATDDAWQQKLETLNNRIERLGPINLVAIEEYTEQSERKNYLDKQSDDLTQALTTLEEAIRKMDRETRTLFKDTFDKVNEHFQTFFPQLFGGGSAYLELTDNDLLETGVAVMARPPGKRNSTIHLLSGGEKALTAVALVFSIFQLNPAPFCLLDEVDAPLDDANVERYCETLKVISERTQLVYITHNKISMEMAEILVGVTMSEPGVSRLVAVDVEEALEMVAR
jgi:chromosome segregation protein